MPFGAVAANRLALALPRTQPLDHRRPDEEGDGERRDHRAAAAKGEVAEQVEQRDAVGERDEQVVEHAARVPTVRSLLWRWARFCLYAPRLPFMRFFQHVHQPLARVLAVRFLRAEAL